MFNQSATSIQQIVLTSTRSRQYTIQTFLQIGTCYNNPAVCGGLPITTNSKTYRYALYYLRIGSSYSDTFWDFHGREKVTEYTKNRKTIGERHQEAATAIEIAKSTKICPYCKARIDEIHGGCDHRTCKFLKFCALSKWCVVG